jgi:hypothetical protein
VSVYRDEPGTKVTPLDYGFELVQRPKRTIARQTLTPKGETRRRRVAALAARGYKIINARGTGMVESPDGRFLASIAAAARMERL